MITMESFRHAVEVEELIEDALSRQRKFEIVGMEWTNYDDEVVIKIKKRKETGR